MELLAVVAILAVVFVIGGSEISRAWKRQKLQSASTDIKILFQRAFPEMQRRNMPVFVKIGPLDTTTAPPAKYLPIALIGDADQDGVVCVQNPPTVACPDVLIDQYNIVVIGATGTMGTSGIDQEFSLSVTDPTKIESTFWSGSDPDPTKSTSWTIPLLLRCDFQGRAIDPASGRQITAPATLVLTHVDIVRGSLMPATRYVIGINPIWSVRVMKQINATPSDPATWVTQNG